MAGNPRMHRVADRVQVELSDIIRTQLKDPRHGFLTLTRVSMTPDLRSARVFVSTLDGSTLDDTLATLTRARGFLRSRLGERLHLRHIPELQFLPDRSGEHVQRVSELLRRIHDEDGPDAPEPDDA